MIRIGIVGAENSHTVAIAKTLNVARAVPGCRVVALWGETEEHAARSAAEGRIPTIVDRPADLIGLADAVVIDHRHAKFHLPAAEHFLRARLPMFIDKPFCYRLAEGRRFLDRARKLRVPVVSFSTVPLQKSARDFAKAIRKEKVVSVTAAGPCDLASVYGGIFFYGIHQVDLLLECFGLDVVAVAVAQTKGQPGAVATLWWDGGLVGTMHCLTGWNTGFQLAAVTEDSPRAVKIENDPQPYLTGIRTFCRMFRTGKEPMDHRRLLAPIAVLEAMEKSVRTGKVQKVAKV
jgi:predicted dehydrogenase